MFALSFHPVISCSIQFTCFAGLIISNKYKQKLFCPHLVLKDYKESEIEFEYLQPLSMLIFRRKNLSI